MAGAKKIFLVEDDSDIASLLQLSLKDEGYEIVHEADGTRALEQLEKHVWDAVILDLTPREFDLLYFFARHPGEVFSRQALLDQVWGYQHEGYEHTVNSHINRLRTKIEKDAAEPEIILTVWGRGYKLAAVNAEHQP